MWPGSSVSGLYLQPSRSLLFRRRQGRARPGRGLCRAQGHGRRARSSAGSGRSSTTRRCRRRWRREHAVRQGRVVDPGDGGHHGAVPPQFAEPGAALHHLEPALHEHEPGSECVACAARGDIRALLFDLLQRSRSRAASRCSSVVVDASDLQRCQAGHRPAGEGRGPRLRPARPHRGAQLPPVEGHLTDTAAPSRWLLLSSRWLSSRFTVLRLGHAAALDLRSDEAYYWTGRIRRC